MGAGRCGASGAGRCDRLSTLGRARAAPEEAGSETLRGRGGGGGRAAHSIQIGGQPWAADSGVAPPCRERSLSARGRAAGKAPRPGGPRTAAAAPPQAHSAPAPCRAGWTGPQAPPPVGCMRTSRGRHYWAVLAPRQRSRQQQVGSPKGLPGRMPWRGTAAARDGGLFMSWCWRCASWRHTAFAVPCQAPWTKLGDGHRRATAAPRPPCSAPLLPQTRCTAAWPSRGTRLGPAGRRRTPLCSTGHAGWGAGQVLRLQQRHAARQGRGIAPKMHRGCHSRAQLRQRLPSAALQGRALGPVGWLQPCHRCRPSAMEPPQLRAGLRQA